MKYFLATLSIFLLIFTGCDQQNRCYDSVNSLMVVSLKSSDFSVYNNLIVYGVGRTNTGDTLVNDTTSSQLKRFALPLSVSRDTTGFVFKIGNVKDTIYFRHNMTMKFISESCGFAPEYKLTSTFFSPGIDSVKFSDPIVNTKSINKNSNAQNTIIYFNSTFH